MCSTSLVSSWLFLISRTMLSPRLCCLDFKSFRRSQIYKTTVTRLLFKAWKNIAMAHHMVYISIWGRLPQPEASCWKLLRLATPGKLGLAKMAPHAVPQSCAAHTHRGACPCSPMLFSKPVCLLGRLSGRSELTPLSIWVLHLFNSNPLSGHCGPGALHKC